MGSRLIRKQIPSLSDAPRFLGIEEKQRIAGNDYTIVPLTMAPALVPCRMFIQIPHGFSALMMSNGKDAGLWGPGLHYCPPWITISNLVPWQHVVFDAPVKQCPTLDNVMVSIDVSLVFKILRDESHIRAFCYNMGPDKLDKYLRAFQEEAIRDMARKKKHTNIYDLMDTASDEQLENTKRKMNDNLKEYGVEIQSITITNVHLPDDISATMEKETTYESLSAKAKRQQEYELLVLEDKEKLHKRHQSVKEQVAEVKSEGERSAANARADLMSVEADTKKLIAQIKENELSEVNQIMAKSDFKVSELHSSTRLALAKIESDGNARADQILAEARAYQSLRRAAAAKQVAENESQALSIRADAEAVASGLLEAKREYDEANESIKVLQAVTRNEGVTVAGDNGDNVMAQMLIAYQNASMIGLTTK